MAVDTMIGIRFNGDDLDRYKAIAHLRRMSFSAWVRTACEAQARQEVDMYGWAVIHQEVRKLKENK